MSLADEALYLSRLGCRILPLTPNAKTPLLSNGLHGASYGEADVTRWWRRWPRANIGMVLGDLLVVDNDNPKHGGDLSATHHLGAPCVLTPSGGTHHYFLRPDVIQHKTTHKHVDFLTKDAYVLMPPSVIDGVRYRWSSGDAGHLLNVTTPDLVDLSPLLPSYGGHGGQLDLSVLEEGERNNKLYGLGTRLLSFGYPFDLVEGIVGAVSTVMPGELDKGELTRIMHSLRRYRANPVARLWRSPKDRLSSDELDHKFALLAGVLRGASAVSDVLIACYSAVLHYVTVTFDLTRDWIYARVYAAMKYRPNYAHFLRRNGAHDAMWRTS